MLMKRWTVQHSGGDIDDHQGVFVIDASLGYLLNRAARMMASQLAEELRPSGIGIGQWPVLVFLWARDGMSQAELARVVTIEPPTMARTIDRMVRDGLVERRSDPHDARLSRVNLTPRGHALRDELVPRAAALNAWILDRLGPDGQSLLTLLRRVAEDIESRSTHDSADHGAAATTGGTS